MARHGASGGSTRTGWTGGHRFRPEDDKWWEGGGSIEMMGRLADGALDDSTVLALALRSWSLEEDELGWAFIFSQNSASSQQVA